MTVRIYKAEPIHLKMVFWDLSDQTRDEIRCSEFNAAAVQQSLALQVEEGGAFVWSENDRVLAVFGFNDYGDYLSMWTVAAKGYYETGVRGVLSLRRFFRNTKFDKPLVVVTTSPNKQTPRWLGILGFSPVSEDGPTSVFEYTG